MPQAFNKEKALTVDENYDQDIGAQNQLVGFGRLFSTKAEADQN